MNKQCFADFIQVHIGFGFVKIILSLFLKMFKREATKQCWSNCNSDSRYPDRLPEGTFFIRFLKPGKLCDNMTEWEKNQAKLKTEKAKCWQFCVEGRIFRSLNK